MKKRVLTALSDDTEPVYKRARLLNPSPLLPSLEEEISIDQTFISSDSHSEPDDNDIIEIMNSPCQQIDTTIIIDSDDEQSIDVTSDDSPPSISSILDAFIPSPFSDIFETIEDQEHQAGNNDNNEIIDLTEDEPLSTQLERKSSIDDEQCPICLETFSDLQYTGVYLTMTQCHHVMCILCSGHVLAHSSRCPLCRESINVTTLMPYCILT